jgi:hypothetical protein
MKARIRHKKSSLLKSQKSNWMMLALLVVGVVLLGAGLVVYVTGSSSANASSEYNLDDVVNDQPIVAIHEMGEGPVIPYLPANQAQPKIQIPEKSFDFGLIGPQDVVEGEFIIRNVGDAPLTVSRAYTTCGCTTAEISATVIPPGKVATIKLIFDAGFHDTAGQTVRRGLIIENNDPQQSQAEIWVQAAVRSN